MIARCTGHHQGRPPTRLYDPAPVMALVAHLSQRQAAWFLGIDSARVARYRSGKRWMMPNTADRCALLLNTTPDQLWEDFGMPCCEYTARGMALEAMNEGAVTSA